VWRILCACTTAGAAFMAWNGAQLPLAQLSPQYLVLYWGSFFVLLLVSVYIAFVDIRYIHLRYQLEQRELFRETLGDETFRKALADAYAKKNGNREVKQPPT